MHTLCRLIFIGFVGVYAAALTLLVLSGGGLSGAARDPTAWLLFKTLALPWSLLRHMVPSNISPFFVAAAPTVNILILWSFCGSSRR